MRKFPTIELPSRHWNEQLVLTACVPFGTRLSFSCVTGEVSASAFVRGMTVTFSVFFIGFWRQRDALSV